jgi:hypothetical protein
MGNLCLSLGKSTLFLKEGALPQGKFIFSQEKLYFSLKKISYSMGNLLEIDI